nr:MAG TPA: hypothetical protein [Caudoviricetes sp.]
MNEPEIVLDTEDFNCIEIYNNRIDFIYDAGYCYDTLYFDNLSDVEIDKIIKLLQNVKKERN